MSEECPVCIIPYNKTSHRVTVCPYCSVCGCRKCYETFVLNEPYVTCMNRKCGKRWTNKEIRDKFTIMFITTELKEHKENNLFERERALMPISQQEANWRMSEKSRLEETNELYKKVEKMMTDYKNTVLKPYYDRIVELNEHPNNRVKVKSEGQFIRACSLSNCKGFLSTKWKCGLCDVYTCNNCGVVKGKVSTDEYNNHICLADDIATMNLISSDTRACPKCAEGIYKISGCDQMWCTMCKTAFSWKTGRIENRIHNPHYYEYLRTQGTVQRERGDIECGRELDTTLTNNLVGIIEKICVYDNVPMRDYFTDLIKKVTNIVRNVIHIREVEIRRMPNYEERHSELRVQYLMGHLTEEVFKKQLQMDDKKMQKTTDMNNVYELVVTSVTDIIYRYREYLTTVMDNLISVYGERVVPVRTGTVPPSVRARGVQVVPQLPICGDYEELDRCDITLDDTILNEIEQIVKYANENFVEIARIYNCKVKILQKSCGTF